MRAHELFRLLILVAGAGAGAVGSAALAAEAMPAWGAALASADLKAGQREAAKCQSCHDLTPARTTMMGPPLWGVVDRPRAKAPGFRYSTAMKASNAPWTYDRLYSFLKNPETDVPGTAMSFAGIANAKARVNLIAWLRTQSEKPVPAVAAKKSGK
jgi:cytochrome c